MADLVNSSPEMEFQAEDKQSSSPAVQLKAQEML